jgi:hypothetical protein
MTITYPNETVLNAVVLSREEEEIRAIAPGCDDVLAFTRIRGTWVSEDLEPVTIAFEYQTAAGTPDAYSDDDYICPKELAASLIQTLLGACERDEAGADGFYVFSPQGSSVAIHRTELKPSRPVKNATAKVV